MTAIGVTKSKKFMKLTIVFVLKSHDTGKLPSSRASVTQSAFTPFPLPPPPQQHQFEI